MTAPNWPTPEPSGGRPELHDPQGAQLLEVVVVDEVGAEFRRFSGPPLNRKLGTHLVDAILDGFRARPEKTRAASAERR